MFCKKQIEGTVYAIEPVSDNYQQLLRNIGLNNYKNIKTFQFAVGSYNHEAPIYKSDSRNLSCMDKNLPYRQYSGSEIVEVKTLDDFCLEQNIYPNAIRMDVEGYEDKIIRGMNNILNAGYPMKLFIEVHFNILREKLIPMLNKLKESGFKIDVLTIETHPCVMQSKLGKRIINWFDKKLGLPQGYSNITIEEMINNPIFINGQIEYAEVVFVR